MDSKILTFFPTPFFFLQEKSIAGVLAPELRNWKKKKKPLKPLIGCPAALIRRSRISSTLGIRSDDSRAEGNLTSVGSSLHNNREEERKCELHEAGGKKKKLSYTPKMKVSSFCFWIPLDPWIPPGLMKQSEVFAVKSINYLGLRSESWSAAYLYGTPVVFSVP